MTRTPRGPEPLRRLFHPGNGAPPPHLAGRDEIKAVFSDLAAALAEGWQIDQDLILFGPRGNGKTVLLDACARTLRGHEVDRVNATSAKIPTVASLCSLLTAGGESGAPSRLAGLSDFHRVEEAGVGRSIAHLKMRRVDDVEVAARLEDHLQQRLRKRPLAVLLDEAHVLDPEVGRYLLNLSQDLRRGGHPFALVMAGTPGLEAHLDRMAASFWERSEIVAVGRLSIEATREAFIKPFESRGVQVDSDALDAVVERSQQYPYFIQLWGQALCLRLEAASADRITMATVRSAEEPVRKRQSHFYRRRCGEIERAELLEAALLVGAAFADGGAPPQAGDGRPEVPRHLLQRHLEAELSLSAAQGRDALDAFIGLGYIWEPEGHGAVAPGIPNLMSHLAAEGVRRASAPLRKRMPRQSPPLS